MTNEPALDESAAARVAASQRCDVDGCELIALASYVWDWGEQGVCCGTHQTILGQKATALKRQIRFAALNPGAPPPLTRDERAMLIAQKLSAEAEADEIKARNADLMQVNKQLALQVQTLTTVRRELEAQQRDAEGKRVEADGIADRLRAEAAELADELSRLRIIAEAQGGASDGDIQPGTG